MDLVIALFPNDQKRQSFDYAIHIRKFLEDKGVKVVVEDDKAEQIGASPLSSIDEKEIKFMISMGGDGTILNLSHKYAHLDAAILGINLGHLGFMADVPLEDIYPSLKDLLDGAYTIDERIVLEGSDGKQMVRAVNDIVIHRDRNYSLVELAIQVDGVYVNTFVADGIIIATPNGSTAYSLAAGGPIISPELNALVITPICPHTISNRPIVLSADHTIEIQYLSNYEPVEVRSDGIESMPLCTGQSFLVKKSNWTFKLVNLHRHEYFSTLRTKLNWSGKLR